jgi:hypothetical protein
LLGIVEDARNRGAVHRFRPISRAKFANGGRQIMFDCPRRKSKTLPNLGIGKAMAAPEQALDFALGKPLSRIVLTVVSHRAFRTAATATGNDDKPQKPPRRADAYGARPHSQVISPDVL